MLHDSATLIDFWCRAEQSTPVVIVGGGRWARVWVTVVSQARGTASDIIMVARNDPDDLRSWLSARPPLAAVQVAPSVEQAFEPAAASFAIISSRPADHVADGLAAMACGADILVEKPLSCDASSARQLVKAACEAGRVLAIGTEFAFLPALHQCARWLASAGEENLRMALLWDDPVEEVRHGTGKTRHVEVSVLADLLPHAVSIFSIFHGEPMGVLAAREDFGLSSGRLQLSGGAGRQYELVYNACSDRRRRVLQIETDRDQACVDFSTEPPRIVINGVHQPIERMLRSLTSTLRLELGAFMSERTSDHPLTALTANLPAQVRLADELEKAQSSKRLDLGKQS